MKFADYEHIFCSGFSCSECPFDTGINCKLSELYKEKADVRQYINVARKEKEYFAEVLSRGGFREKFMGGRLM